MRKLFKNERGITLIALVITIIILLILAGVAISTLAENGLFEKAKLAKEVQTQTEMREQLVLALSELQLEKKGEASINNVTQEWANSSLEDYNPVITEGAEENTRRISMTKNGVSVSYIIDEKLSIQEIEEIDQIKTGLISDTEYIINNQVLKFSKIVVIGENEEYKTVKEGFDYLCDNGYKENGAILLREGSYDTADIHTGNSYSIYSKYNEMSISIIADCPGRTYMTAGEMEMNINSESWIELKFYRIIFTTPVYSDAGNNGFILNYENKLKEYYNCVFIPPTGGMCKKLNESPINTYNCLFIGGANTFYSSNPLNGKAQNCASTTTAIPPANGTKETCLTNITVDSQYNITTEGWKNTGTGINPDGSKANIGVYGGEYSW